MNSTDAGHLELAAAFFDEVIEPLARARREAGAGPCFPLGPDDGADSYFETPSPVRRMTPADFEFPGGGTPEGLVGALGRYWAAQGEPVLAAASPRLGEVADAVARANITPTEEVDIFCYSLF